MKKFLILCIFLAGISAMWAKDDDISSMLGGLGESLGKSYAGPLPEGFCTNMNSGWFNKAPEDEILGFDLELSLVGMGTKFEESDKTFEINNPVPITISKEMVRNLATDLVEGNNVPEGAQRGEITRLTDYIWEKLDGEGDEKTIGNVNVTAYGPTVVGSEEDEVMIVIDNSGLTNYTDSVTGSNYKLSDVKNRTIKSGVTGLDLPILPLGAFQISLGTLYGTRGTFRFLPPIDVDEKIGKVSYYGGALQHNPKMFLPALDILPFDLDVSGSYQIFKLGSIIKSTAWTAGMNVSRKFGWDFLNLTPYAGVMLESSTMKFSYDYELDLDNGETEKIPISFDVDGPNKYRIPLGLGVRLGILNISGEYFFAKQSGFSAAVAVAF